MVNHVVLIGRLGQDPEIKYFDSGSVKAKFSVAVDRSVSRENKQTDWFNIETWGKQAEIVGEWIKKGQLVSVTGSLEVQRWTDNTGNQREMCLIRANEIRMEGSRRDQQAYNAGGGYNAAPQQPAMAGQAPF